MDTRTTPHFLRFARALALGASLGAAGCAAVAMPASDDGGDVATPDTPQPPDSQPSGCTCCPSGCSPCTSTCGIGFGPDAGPPDNGPLLTPPAGSRWCVLPERDLHGNSCPIAGPLAPPELRA